MTKKAYIDDAGIGSIVQDIDDRAHKIRELENEQKRQTYYLAEVLIKEGMVEYLKVDMTRLRRHYC